MKPICYLEQRGCMEVKKDVMQSDFTSLFWQGQDASEDSFFLSLQAKLPITLVSWGRKQVEIW